MRPMTQDYYGIPAERVVGTGMGLEYDADDNVLRSRFARSTSGERGLGQASEAQRKPMCDMPVSSA